MHNCMCPYVMQYCLSREKKYCHERVLYQNANEKVKSFVESLNETHFTGDLLVSMTTFLCL